MPKYYGFLVSDAWLMQHCIDLGESPKDDSHEEYESCIDYAYMAVTSHAGVWLRSKFVGVRVREDKTSMCIALASTDPWDHLPLQASPEDVESLRKALGKGPNVRPRWYPYS